MFLSYQPEKETVLKRTALTLGLTLAVGIMMGVAGIQVLEGQQKPKKKVTELLRADLAGEQGKEVVVRLIEADPGVVGKQHYHPGHVFVYILEGAWTVKEEGKSSVTKTTGDIHYERPGHPMKTKNVSTVETYKNLVIQIKKKGEPWSIKVK